MLLCRCQTSVEKLHFRVQVKSHADIGVDQKMVDMFKIDQNNQSVIKIVD